MKLSVVIIAKDAQEQIGDALSSVTFADEIIVVDGGSSDDTVKIAEKKGAKIIRYASHDFADLRTVGLKRAQGEWVLYVDTDERVTQELIKQIKNNIFNIKDRTITAYRIKRKNFYLGNYEWPHVEKLERLFRRKKLQGWYGKLHESPRFEGKVGELDGFLLHYTHRDLSSMLAKTIEWSKIEAELRLKVGHPKMAWWRFPRVMFSAFIRSYVSQGGWKVGPVGLIESIYQAFSIFITYARLWELQKLKTKNEK